MTDRILPAISIPIPAGRGVAQPVARPRQRPMARPATAHRKEGFLTTPARAGMLLGGSAAVYAVTLAGIAALQASSDAQVAARRQPWVDQVAEARSANDALEQALLRADADARWLASEYDTVGGDVATYQARLDDLAALVAEVEGSAAALPTRIALPKVTMRGAVTTRSSSGRSSAPTSTSTSGASGG
ncbi:MAG TPA: hypothetical protein VGK16_03200 [Candidatus Limnocylindrales bacterium]